MKRQRRGWSRVVCVAVGAWVLVIGTARACGPYFDLAAYDFSRHPDFPLTNYAAGRIGVLQPEYTQSYLFVAYRYFSGVSLDRDEQAAMVELWNQRFSWDDGLAAAVKQWLEARTGVPGAAKVDDIDVNRTLSDGFTQYVNCNPDAFKSAAGTLAAMTAKFGAGSQAVKDWVGAQDIVFGDCAKGAAIPVAAPANASLYERAQRDYQIAAANFYGGNFDAAQKLFVAIGNDNGSPWRAMGPYLAARAQIRKATLASTKTDNAGLAAARAELAKITDHGMPQRLIDFIDFRIDPAGREKALAVAVMRSHSGATLKQNLWDYTLVLDQVAGPGAGAGPAAGATPAATATPAVKASDDLADWLITFHTDPKADHALERWKATHSMPWLVAAIAKISANNPDAAAVEAAAGKVGADSPAFEMLAYNRARLTLDAGDADGARKQLDALLSDAKLPLSARNQTLALRMRVARDEGEFFRYAQRRPTAIVNSGVEYPEDPSTNPAIASLLARTSFDTDSTTIMNRAMALAMLTHPLAGDALPPALRREVALAAWTRAIVLKDDTSGRKLAPTVAEVAPELNPQMEAYSGAATPAARRVEAIYTILWNPGMRPYVAAGGGRTEALGKIDDFRDNWWCSATGSSAQWFVNNYVWSPPSSTAEDQKVTAPSFFSAADRDAGASEASRVAAINGPNLLLAETIAAVKLNPGDARNPEALHRAVMSVRYGCGDANTAKLSKAAFDLLHSRYPKSEWAAKTKFWFK